MIISPNHATTINLSRENKRGAKMINDNMLKLNIQFFSEDETTEETIENGQENSDTEEKVKTYTEDEFNEKLQNELTRRLKQRPGLQ